MIIEKFSVLLTTCAYKIGRYLDFLFTHIFYLRKLKRCTAKDGHYFIQILENEIKRLLILADAVEIDLLDEHLPEETKGKLRSASGKARLLTSQKMQQFKGLCTKNINQVSTVDAA